MSPGLENDHSPILANAVNVNLMTLECHDASCKKYA